MADYQHHELKSHEPCDAAPAPVKIEQYDQAFEATDRGLFDFVGKKKEEEEKCEVCEEKKEEPEERKKHESLLEKLHRSNSSSSSENLKKDDVKTLPYGNSVFFTVRKIDLAGKIILGINKRGVHFFHPVPYKHLHSAQLSEIKQFDSSNTAVFFTMRVADEVKRFRFETKQGAEICVALMTHINDVLLLRDSEARTAANGLVNGLSFEESENKEMKTSSSAPANKPTKKALKQDIPKPTKRQRSTRLISKFSNKLTEPLITENEDEAGDEAGPVIPHSPKMPLAVPLAQEASKPADIVSAVQNATFNTSNHVSQDRVSRKAPMLDSKSSKKTVLDLSFVEAARSNTTPRIAPFPTDGAVSLAKTTIRHFFGLDPLKLNELERTIMLSALSVLQATPGFSDSPTGQVLGSLSSLFTTCHATAQASLDLTSKVQAFTVEKADIDNVATERDKKSNDLTLLNENYEATEKLVEKAKAEVVQYEATLMDLLEKSETLETSVAKLDQEVYDRGAKLTAQKEDFQRWNSTLQELEQTQAECYAKWENLRKLDLD